MPVGCAVLAFFETALPPPCSSAQSLDVPATAAAAAAAVPVPAAVLPSLDAFPVSVKQPGVTATGGTSPAPAAGDELTLPGSESLTPACTASGVDAQGTVLPATGLASQSTGSKGAIPAAAPPIGGTADDVSCGAKRRACPTWVSDQPSKKAGDPVLRPSITLAQALTTNGPAFCSAGMLASYTAMGSSQATQGTAAATGDANPLQKPVTRTDPQATKGAAAAAGADMLLKPAACTDPQSALSGAESSSSDVYDHDVVMADREGSLGVENASSEGAAGVQLHSMMPRSAAVPSAAVSPVPAPHRYTTKHDAGVSQLATPLQNPAGAGSAAAVAAAAAEEMSAAAAVRAAASAVADTSAAQVRSCSAVAEPAGSLVQAGQQKAQQSGPNITFPDSTRPPPAADTTASAGTTRTLTAAPAAASLAAAGVTADGSSTQAVAPGDVAALDPTGAAALTLATEATAAAVAGDNITRAAAADTEAAVSEIAGTGAVAAAAEAVAEAVAAPVQGAKKAAVSSKGAGLKAELATPSAEAPKLMADLVESLLGAVFLDSGRDLEVVWKVGGKQGQLIDLQVDCMCVVIVQAVPWQKIYQCL